MRVNSRPHCKACGRVFLARDLGEAVCDGETDHPTWDEQFWDGQMARANYADYDVYESEAWQAGYEYETSTTTGDDT